MKVQKLLEKPEAWCKGHYALDSESYQVFTHSSTACRFCLAGAVDHCYNNDVIGRLDAYHMIRKAINKLFPDLGQFIGIAEFNDRPETTHEDVLAVVREANI